VRWAVWLGLSAVLAAFGLLAAASAAERASGRLEVFVSILPQAYFVERVGGENVVVHVMVQTGQDPHTFEPMPRQLVELGHAKLYFKIGLPFEARLVEKIQEGYHQLTIVDMAKGIKKRLMVEEEHEHAAAGSKGGAASQEGSGKEGAAPRVEPDPHVWLSPPLISIMAKNIAEALVQADPAHADQYRKNLAAFQKDIDATHARIQKVLAPYKGESFYVYHPAFGYFADAYGLKQQAVEVEGKSPTPKQMAELIAKARADGVRIVFVQPQFDSKSAQAIATAIDGAVVPMDDLAKNVLENLEKMAADVQRALKGRSAPAASASAGGR
jgi:zinc transport system substrate-binding protein